MKNIKPILKEHIDPNAHLVTDDSSIYFMMKPEFAKHSTINHSEGKYVRKEVDGMMATTNAVESYFSLIKRSVYGIHHHMSWKHLGKYCTERDFIYNSRKLTDDALADKGLKAIRGKRLMLNAPKGT